MKDPNADTEWNDILRAKGIIPPKETEVTEDDVIDMIENTIEQKSKGLFLLPIILLTIDLKYFEESNIFNSSIMQNVHKIKSDFVHSFIFLASFKDSCFHGLSFFNF